MPAPLAKGIIITVSVLLAAGLAAYESDQFRAWIDRTRHKIAMGLHSLGDDISPHQKSPKPADASMTEEKGDLAEARRKQKREEILERSRLMEESRKRRKVSTNSNSLSPSFDTLVDQEGKLRGDSGNDISPALATTSAVEANDQAGTVRSRHNIPVEDDLTQSSGSSIPVRHVSQSNNHQVLEDPFESRYEREMRTTWNIPVGERAFTMPSTHASESLIDLTPTTENAPDPEISVPSLQHGDYGAQQREYFSTASSQASVASSHTMSEDEPEYYYAHPSQPLVPIHPRTQLDRPEIEYSVSSASSIAGSATFLNASEAEASEDDLMSDFGDGARTPASVWTEVGSSISGED